MLYIIDEKTNKTMTPEEYLTKKNNDETEEKEMTINYKTMMEIEDKKNVEEMEFYIFNEKGEKVEVVGEYLEELMEIYKRLNLKF